jgi:peptidoglycan hydrolase-like protein with peptidoglycan-binding domain
VDEVSGQIGRLNNLGYDAGELDSPVASPEQERHRSEHFRSAVEEFQCDHGLLVDGICGARTQAKLEEIHGC